MKYIKSLKEVNSINDYYEVEKIIARKFVGKNKLYLIKWLGYPLKDCTWEPISHLDKINTLVDNFDKNYPYSIDKRRLRKFLRSKNKKHNHKSKKKKETNENNHIIINLEESTIINKEEKKEGEKESIKTNSNETDEQVENNDFNHSKLIRPIII